jgi:hypothetical protein
VAIGIKNVTRSTANTVFYSGYPPFFILIPHASSGATVGAGTGRPQSYLIVPVELSTVTSLYSGQVFEVFSEFC